VNFVKPECRTTSNRVVPARMVGSRDHNAPGKIDEASPVGLQAGRIAKGRLGMRLRLESIIPFYIVGKADK